MTTHADPATEPVTVVVSRSVRPGRERDFERWADDLIAVASTWPGFLGASVLKPGRGSQDFHLVYRFESPERLRAWDESRERVRWLERAEGFLAAEHRVQHVTGLETWFALPGQTMMTPPKRWKMALLTFVGGFPMQFAFAYFVTPHIKTWPLVVRSILLTGILVLLLTFVVMPQITKVFRRFLYPPGQR